MMQISNIFSLSSVIQKEICCQANDEEKDAKNHNIQLSLEQGDCHQKETSFSSVKSKREREGGPES